MASSKASQKGELLRDTCMFDFKVAKVPKDLKGSVLKRLKGTATFNDAMNRNTRYYRDGFWNSVLDNNERVKELLATRTFFGSARHPRQDEAPMPELDDASHAIAGYRIDDKGTVEIDIDVLNTPNGRLIDTYINYGSKLGLSTRAYGEQKEDKKGRMVPVEDKYHFVTWDFVGFPAFADTRAEPITDSYEVDLDSLNISATKEDVINDAKKMKPEEAKVLCDYIGIDYDKDVKEPEEEPVSDEEESGKLKKQLGEATDKILTLEDEVKGLKDKQKDSQTLVKKDKEAQQTLRDTMREELAGEFQHQIADATKALSTLKGKHTKLKTKLDSKDGDLVTLRKTLADTRIEAQQRILELKESLEGEKALITQQKGTISDLNEQKDEAIKAAEDVLEDYRKLTDRTALLEKELQDNHDFTESQNTEDKEELSDQNTSTVSDDSRPRLAALDTSGIQDTEMDGLRKTGEKFKKK